MSIVHTRQVQHGVVVEQLTADVNVDVRSFKISEVKAVNKDGNNYHIKGELTVKGITKKIEFPAKVEKTESGLTASAEIVVDRAKFDVRYGSGSFFENLGDKMIYDDFTLDVKLVGAK